MQKRALAVIPAAIIPAMLLGMQHMHAPDFLIGLAVGGLIGLTIVLVVRRQGCAPTA